VAKKIAGLSVVMPAKADIQKLSELLDSGSR
jgi:hypothetical protein